MAETNHVQKSQASEVLGLLKYGCYMTKVRKGNKKFRRFFLMDDDFVTIFYSSTQKESNKKRKVAVKVTEIQDVREGANTDVFVKSFSKLGVPRDHCLSIVLGDKFKTLDLIGDSKEVRDKWVWGLRHLKKKYREADLTTQQDVWMRQLFRYADKNGDKSLGMKEIVNLLKHLNIEVDYREARKIFDAADTKLDNGRTDGQLDIDEFMDFYRMLTKRTEMEDLFHKYNEEGNFMDAGELQKFLKEEEGEDLSVEDCLKLIEENEPFPDVKKQSQLSIDGFNTLMNSPLLNIFNHEHLRVYQDMSLPISQYFVDSSHNTYLTADQLVGPSAVEAYIKALKRGCRCVELDCWDADTDEEEPIIYHGYTLTSKISFRDTCLGIKKYAFEVSPYPVILSIENHCNVEQQKLLAKIMKEVFEEKLYIPSVDETSLPSPKDLQGRILIKAKKLPPNKVEGEVSDEDEAADMEDETVKEDVKKNKKKQKIKLSKDLSDIVSLGSVSFKSFQYSRNNYDSTQMSSLGESKALALSSDDPQGLASHTTFQFVRTYPSGTRTDSSNYNPSPMWNTGCQIVALNYQTPDEHMMVYKGKFRDNGGCGYILKPPILLSDDQEFNASGPFPPEWKKKLTIKVISGYQFPKQKGRDILDPYVQIFVRGVKADEQSAKTEYIKNNGFNPVWNETLEFNVSVPELAVVMFHVIDYDTMSANDLVAQYALPFNSIKEGHRVVHMQNKHSVPIWGCSLFVHVSIN